MTASVAAGLFTADQWQSVEEFLQGLDAQQSLWLGGYLSARSLAQNPAANDRPGTAIPSPGASDNHTKVLIAFGSETGNCENLARQLAAQASHQGLPVELLNLGQLRLRQLAKHRRLLVICSTHGDGDPPEPISSFYDNLMQAEAPTLPELEYAVLALGDSSYEKFCATGHELDERLAALGGKRLLPCTECDVDFATPAKDWMQAVLNTLQPRSHAASQRTGITATPALIEHGNRHAAAAYSKQAPLGVELLDTVRLSHERRHDAIYHLELALDVADFALEPGDAVGVLVDNPPALVAALLKATGLSGESPVTQNGVAMPLVQALRQECNLNIPGKRFAEFWAALSAHAELHAILEDAEQARDFLKQWQVIDIVTQWPAHPQAQALVDHLRPLQPRLYDVANSLKQRADELHLTVKHYHYTFRDREESGIASSFLRHLQAGESLRLYPHRNARFHLPAEPDPPLILIAEGTGIAPYRAFLQEIQSASLQHKCWIFFSEKTFRDDFLYQAELQELHRQGLLENISTAFSHDNPPRLLPDVLLAEAEAVAKWLTTGAHIYFCGDKELMERSENSLCQHPAIAACWPDVQAQKRLHRNLY